MKSLSYLITKKNPKGWSDCMDYCCRLPDLSSRTEISVQLSVKERVCSDFTLISYYAAYSWTFADGSVCRFDKVYGGVCEYDSPRRHELMRRVAIQRLQKDFDSLNRCGVGYCIASTTEENWYIAETVKTECS